MNRLTTLLLAALLCSGVGGPVLGATRLPAAEVARAAGRDGDPTLNAIYAGRGFAPLWVGDERSVARRDVLQALIASDPAMPGLPQPPFGAGDQSIAAEIATTRIALDYLAHLSGGVPVAPARAMKAMQRLERASPATPLATALLELELVRDLGGWRRVGTLPGPLPTVPPTEVVSPEVDVAPEMPRRTTLPEPVSLRQRLVQSGDLPATASAGTEMDAALTDGGVALPGSERSTR